MSCKNVYPKLLSNLLVEIATVILEHSESCSLSFSAARDIYVDIASSSKLKSRTPVAYALEVNICFLLCSAFYNSIHGKPFNSITVLSTLILVFFRIHL